MTTITRAELCAECQTRQRECKFVRVYRLNGQMGWVCYECRRKAWRKQRVQEQNKVELDKGYY